jgi:hypothetical protein
MNRVGACGILTILLLPIPAAALQITGVLEGREVQKTLSQRRLRNLYGMVGSAKVQ